MAVDPRSIEADIAGAASRVSFADAEHSLAHIHTAQAIAALATAVDSGVTGDSGATINALLADFRSIETQFAGVKTSVDALNLVPGPAGAKGAKGNAGRSVGVTVADSAPGSAAAGDFWIDGSEAFVYSGGAWLKLNGRDGARGPEGDPGASVETVTASDLAPGAAPTTDWNRATGLLRLGIPRGKDGAPFMFRGLLLDRNLLPSAMGVRGEAYSIDGGGGANTEIVVSDGANWVTVARLGNGSDGTIGPVGPPGLNAFETWKKLTASPSAGLSDWLLAFRGPMGPRGEAGKPGETLKVQGIVATTDQLPSNPKALTVIAVQADLTMYVYDPFSPAAGDNGWVDMGQVQGPPGESAFLDIPVNTDADLPPIGRKGEMRISQESGHIWGWSETLGTWNDGGLLLRATLTSLGDVDIPAAEAGAVLSFDGDLNKWVASEDFAKKDDLLPLATKKYVDLQVESLASGLSHGAPVVNILNEPPALVDALEAYFIVSNTPVENSVFDGNANKVAFFKVGDSGSSEWVFSTPREGETHLVEAQGASYTWNGTAWVKTVAAASTDTTGGLLMVGSVQQSLLTETQFKTLLGDQSANWVLADGRNVANTTYATVTGRQNVPDLRGAYFRMAGNNSTNNSWQGGAFLSWQEDTTRAPRNTAWSIANAGSHTHAYNDPLTDETKLTGNRGVVGTGRGNEEVFLHPKRNIATGSFGNHSHSISGGDTETRPKTFALNYFIKVN